jgi:hypothetical protein
MMTTAVNIICADMRKVAGGSVFGAVPKADWERTMLADRKNRITLGLNCLLLQAGGKAVDGTS